MFLNNNKRMNNPGTELSVVQADKYVKDANNLITKRSSHFQVKKTDTILQYNY